MPFLPLIAIVSLSKSTSLKQTKLNSLGIAPVSFSNMKTTLYFQPAEAMLLSRTSSLGILLILLPLVAWALPNNVVDHSIVVVCFDEISFEAVVHVLVCYKLFNTLRVLQASVDS